MKDKFIDSQKKYWRLLRDKEGLPTTLFHGLSGSRRLPLDEWLDAEIKTVTDGGKKKAKKYKSGFHVLPTLEEIVKFTNRFRRIEDLVIVEVDVQDLWSKEHSPANVWLAARMRIRSKQWEKRLWVKQLT